MADMVFRLLGPIEVHVGGKPADAGPPKQRALLASLLLAANQVVPTAQLLERLWPAGPPRTAAKNLQVYVYQLRKLLGPRLAFVRPGYRLQVRPGELDLAAFHRFAALARQAKAHGDPGRAAGGYRAALGLWRGPALADLTMAGMLEPAAAHLEQLRLQVLDERIDVELGLGRHLHLVPELDRLVADYPLCERLRQHLITALHGSGRAAEATLAYRSAVRLLADELGVPPGRELREAAQRLLGPHCVAA
jgi:DNA-binding SARP family transcriptional activator